jgi:hypothetical protein
MLYWGQHLTESEMVSSSTRGYQAYLVRLWQSNTAEGPVWRASVESPHTGERRAFASLEQLFAFVEDETGRRSTRAQLGDGGETWGAVDRQAGI